MALAAGGTGGHLFPALAVADALRARRSDVELSFIGSSRGLDGALLESRGVWIASTPVTSYASARELPAMSARLARGISQSRRILRERGVQAVIGFGGYPSLPAVLAAATLRVPRIVHEANALERLGLANRLGARTGAEIWGGFGATGSGLGRPVTVCGVPLRETILTLDRAARRGEARSKLGCDPASTVVLCLGGSLGARRINAAVTGLVAAGLPSGWELVCSTGSDRFAETRAAIGDDERVHLLPFIDEMELAYAAADVVVSRAGAATAAEVEHLGLRAVLVPLPIAREREQDRNAAALVARGGARIIPDADLDADRLRAAVAALLDEPEPAADPRHAHAAERLAERLIELAERR